MTQAVITDTNKTVVVQDSKPTTIVTGMMGPAGAATFGELRDIDLSDLVGGSTLVYNTQTQKWVATTLLDQQIIESGQF